MPDRKARIAVTLGDPAGVGPEIIERAVADPRVQHLSPLIIGRAKFISKRYPGLFKSLAPITPSELSPSTAPSPGRHGYLIDAPNDFPLPSPGAGTSETGAESLLYIDAAIELWKKGLIDAIVTAPVSKSLIEKSGTPFSGHTEYFAEKIGEENPFMMMYSTHYRVILCTTHIPLHKVQDSLSVERISEVISAGRQALRAIDGKEPKIAVCGLDPHSGDDGAIGSFDRTVTSNAIERSREAGIDVHGPFAADTLFLSERWGQFDLAVAQYHDQGLIPFKMLAFDTGVNVTLGLSLVRTSVDHGTAFDIAGKGIARHSSMVEAILLAEKLVHLNPPLF